MVAMSGGVDSSVALRVLSEMVLHTIITLDDS